MNNLIILILGSLKFIGLITIGLTQLFITLVIITCITKNKCWLRNVINNLKNWLLKGVYN